MLLQLAAESILSLTGPTFRVRHHELFRFLLLLFSNETLLCLSVTRLTSAVSHASQEVPPQQPLLELTSSRMYTQIFPGSSEHLNPSVCQLLRPVIRHSEAEICPYRIISYIWTPDQWALYIFYWARRECRRSSRPRFPDPSPGSTSSLVQQRHPAVVPPNSTHTASSPPAVPS